MNEAKIRPSIRLRGCASNLVEVQPLEQVNGQTQAVAGGYVCLEAKYVRPLIKGLEQALDDIGIVEDWIELLADQRRAMEEKEEEEADHA
jgi:hypothetical protein